MFAVVGCLRESGCNVVRLIKNSSCRFHYKMYFTRFIEGLWGIDMGL